MNPFYKLKIIANQTDIEKGISINDDGNVAFVADGDLYVGNGTSTPIQYSDGTGTVLPGIQINNQNQVVSTQSFVGGGTNVAIWDASNPNNTGVSAVIATGGVVGSSFERIFSHPSITNFDSSVISPIGHSIVFSGIDQNGIDRLLATPANPNVTGARFNTTPIQNPIYPVISEQGDVLVRLGNRGQTSPSGLPVSPIVLFNNVLGPRPIPIANTVKGFKALGQKPGISDDGQIIVFYGDLESGAKLNEFNNAQSKLIYASNKASLVLPSLTSGPGIFASIKIQETFVDLNGNKTQDNKEDSVDRVIVRIADKTDGFNSFDPDSRISVNSTHRAEKFSDSNSNGIWDIGESFIDNNKNGKFDPTSQRAVTIAYKAFNLADQEGIYTSRLNFFGTRVSEFNPDQPGQFSVSRPTLVIKAGDEVQDPGTDGILGTADDVVLSGKVENLDIYDSVNNRDRGDVAVWVKTNTDRAVVRARPQEVIYLDFKPRTNFKPSRDLGTLIFEDLGLPVEWAGDLASVFSTLAPDRADLNGADDIAIIQDAITNQVRQAFEDIGINVRILNSGSDSIPTDGRFTHIYIGDGPRHIGDPLPDGTLGIASSVDFFNQDLFQEDEKLKGKVRFGRDTVFVFADLIFDPASARFTDPDINIVSLNQTTGPGTITTDQVVNAIARVTLHEIGHALGLAHLENDFSSNLLMDVSIDQDELRKSANFATTDQPLAEVNDVQNDQQRLAFTVGSDNNDLVRTPPSSLLLSNNNRSKFLLSAFLNQSSINVSKAAIGIVPLGEDHIMPELIDLGSGDLATLLSREIEVRNGDKIFLIASTDGNGIDIFGVAANFSGSLADIDLTNGLLVITDERIRGSFVDNSGQPIATSLNLFQETANGFVQIGQLGAGQANSLPTLSITSTQIAEGNNGTQNILLTVSLSTANAQTVTVNFASSDNTAIAGSDYQAVSGTLTFNPGGLLTQTITIPIYGDSTVELDESFSINLTSPTNATIAVSQGVITIQNDDVASSKPATPDFNGDGKADILWRNPTIGRTDLWEMDGSTRLNSTVVTSTVGSAWEVVGTSDFTGDGKADILWRNPTIGRADLWEMDGSTRLSSAIVTSTVGSAWEVVGTSDFTGDGKADILWRNPTIGRADLWEMDGSTRLNSTVVTSTVGSAWEVVGTSDFTGDGKADILWRNPTIGRADLWEMDGSTRLNSTVVTSTVGSAWEVVGTSDFTGDGKADILWRNPTIGRADLWEMDGSTRLNSTVVTSTVGSAWRVAGTQDFSGDGLSDILWRNSDLGRADLWTMSGSSRLSSSIVASNVGSSWRIVN
jgi:hypothetical protein